MRNNAALDQLQASILSGDAGIAAPLVRPKPHMTAAEQVAIYGHAYRIRLRQAVLGDYPCLAHGYMDLPIVVDAYVAATPSTSYNLDFYPFGFWRFAKDKMPEALAELAELEGALAECFMQHGDPPLLPHHLPQDAEALGRMRLRLRAPYRLMRFRYDVEHALARFKRNEPALPVVEKPIHLLVYRPNHDLRRRYLEEDEYHLLKGLTQTATFDDALRQTQQTTALDDDAMAAQVMRWLPLWLQEGVLAAEV